MPNSAVRLAGLALAALSTLTACVVVGVDAQVDEFRYDETPAGYSVRRSDYDFATTLARLQGAIEARGLTTFNVIDHAEGAAGVDVALRPTTLVIFGTPKVGAPIMAASQTAGADLPMKALVYEAENGATYLAITRPSALFARHGVKDLDTVKERAEKTLDAIADETVEG